MKNIILITILSCLFLSQLVFAQLFKPDMQENVEVTMPASAYVIFSHSSSFYDQDSSSAAGVRALLKFAQKFNIETIASVDSDAVNIKESAKNYFITDDEVNYVLLSEAGQHKLSFPNASRIYLAGGNLALCLCEAMRDVVRGVKWDRIEPFRLILVKDAIYDWSKNYDPITLPTLNAFLAKFIIPHFKCPLQNWYGFPELKMRDVKLLVFFDGQHFSDFDLEPNDDISIENLKNSIELDFVDSSELIF